VNRNFNQLTKTIALSLILAIVSGFGNDSINAQTPTSPTVQITSQSCPTQNVDLNQLKTTLNERYEIFNDSLPGLFTSLRDPDTELETIRTQDQITNLGSIYQCVLEAQDNANLGTREQRIAIRQTITDISAILTPAKSGFLVQPEDLPIASDQIKLKIGLVDEQGNPRQGDVPFGTEAIDLLDEKLTDLSQELLSQIDSLQTQTPSPLPNPNDVRQFTDNPSLQLMRGILTIVGALAIVVLLLLLRKNQQFNKTSTISDLDQERTDWKQSDEKLNRDIIKLNALYQELSNKYKDIQQEVFILKNQSIPPKPDNTIALRTTQANNVSTSDPRPLEQQQNGIGVSETRESFEKRWSGLVAPIVLETASNYNFLIINDRELIPKPGSKVTETKLNTIDGLFDYKNFRSGAPFQVIQPAIVSVIPGDRWQVTQKGVLHFE